MSDQSSDPTGAPNLENAGPDEKYRVGTLSYTKAGLVILFGWLLWGDFCFQLFQNIGGTDILPLYLQDNYHISNSKVNLLFNVIPMLIGVIVGPILSFRSDRHRGRFGRRIPYMIWTTPFLCFFAAAIGYSDEILIFVKAHANPSSFFSPMTISMLLISVLVIGFSFFNEFVNTVYWYLFADVVPEQHMGRFLGLFRVVGFAASWLLNKFLAEYKLTHMRDIHVGVAVIYLVGFTLMCLFVKEGEYPPVTDVTEKTTVMEQVKMYFRECFTHRIFILIYLSTVMYVFARAAPMGAIFGLHLSQHVTAANASSGAANAVAMSDSGDAILTAGADGKVALWDGAKNKKLQLLRDLAPAGPVAATSDALSPDGRMAAAGTAQGEIHLWRVSDGREFQTLKGHQGAVLTLAFSPDGKRLASGGEDHAVRIWDVDTGKCLQSIAGHGDKVRGVAFSSDGRELASGGLDKKIQVIDTATGAVTHTMTNVGPVYSLTFLPSLVMPGGTLPKPQLASASQPSTAALAPAASAPAPGVTVASAPAQPPEHKANGFRAVADAIMAVPQDVRDYGVDIFTNESMYDKPADKRSQIVLPDAWVAVGGQDDGDDTRNALVRIYDVQAGAPVMSLKGHKEAITSVRYKSDLKVLLSGSADSSARLWDPADISPTASDQSFKTFSGYTLGVTALSPAATGPLMASVSTDGQVHLWNIDKGVSLRKGGIMASFTMILGLILAYPLGWLVDRFHALRITVLCSLILMPIPFISYFVIHEYVHLVYLEVPKVFLFGLMGAASMPLLISLFPKAKFGQMCSANGLVKQFFQAMLSIVGAWVMDRVTGNSLLTDNFRYAFFWSGAGFILYAFTLVAVYQEWKKLGGDKGYTPPEMATSIEAGPEQTPSGEVD